MSEIAQGQADNQTQAMSLPDNLVRTTTAIPRISRRWLKPANAPQAQYEAMSGIMGAVRTSSVYEIILDAQHNTAYSSPPAKHRRPTVLSLLSGGCFYAPTPPYWFVAHQTHGERRYDPRMTCGTSRR